MDKMNRRPMYRADEPIDITKLKKGLPAKCEHEDRAWVEKGVALGEVIVLMFLSGNQIGVVTEIIQRQVGALDLVQWIPFGNETNDERTYRARPVKKGYLSERTWKEFQDCGLVWWINRGLHLFGWALVLEQDDDGLILDVYPARCRFRGFRQSIEERGFKRLSQYICDVGQQLVDDSEIESLSCDDESDDIDPLVG